MKKLKAQRDTEDLIEMIPFVVLVAVLFLGLCVTYLR